MHTRELHALIKAYDAILLTNAEIGRVAYPNFGHPDKTSFFTKYKFLNVKNYFATIVNEPSVLNLFQLSNDDLLYS